MSSNKPNILLAAERGEFHDYIEELQSNIDPLLSIKSDEELDKECSEIEELSRPEISEEDYDFEFQDL